MEVMETEITTELKFPNDESFEGFNSNIQWLRYLFKANKIDIPTFSAWNECIKMMRYMKVNSIALDVYTHVEKEWQHRICTEWLGTDIILRDIEGYPEPVPCQGLSNTSH